MAMRGADPSMMSTIYAAEDARQAVVLDAANELGDSVVEGADGLTLGLGQFTLVMHGFSISGFNLNSVSGDRPNVYGAPVSEEGMKLVDRYVDLERRFNSGTGRYDERPVAALEHLPERYGDTDNVQITEIAVARPTFGRGPSVGEPPTEDSIQYRIRRVRRSIDDVAPTATQHGFEGTVELPVGNLQSFDDMLGLSEPKDARVVLARLVRTRGSFDLHGEDDFFEDKYSIGLNEIMGQRDFDSRNGNENAEHDLLFMRRALAAKELAVRAMLERTDSPQHMAIMPAGGESVSVVSAEL
jgi:hypothetical protein